MKIPLDSVGGYQIGDFVAGGGMGLVYRAVQPQLRREVAVKFIAPHASGDPILAARFKDEALLSAAVEHPNVLPVYDAGEEDGLFYIVMRLVEGNDLKLHLQQQSRLGVDEAVDLTAQVADGLQAAHDRGVVHRDVKPGNVLLARNGRPHPYLTDFGLAKLFADPAGPTPTGHYVGTPAYVAPEQITGGVTGPPADVYALGCVLYQLLTGRPPFVRDSEVAMVYAHLEADVPSCRDGCPDASPALDRVIGRAMAKDPAERFPSAADFGSAAATAARGAHLHRMTRPVEEVRLESDAIRFGSHLSISFHRTLRVPEDGVVYRMPPGLGRFPVCRVQDYADHVPAEWRRQGGVFIPVYQREAMWISLGGVPWSPNAVKLGVGMVNAVSGARLDLSLVPGRQDYVVCPHQKRLDGIVVGEGRARQFVATPLGFDATLEARVTGREEYGGIQVIAFDQKSEHGTVRTSAPPPMTEPRLRGGAQPGAPRARERAPLEMGISPGGEIEQQVAPDPYGAEAWDDLVPGRVFVHLANSEVFREITGMDPPPSPIEAETYAERGVPWLEAYEETRQAFIEPGDWRRPG